ELDDARLVPSGAVLSTYAGARIAAALLDRPRTRLPLSLLLDELIVARAVRGRIRPELVRCRDGWAIARFRDDGERALLEALARGPVEDAPLAHLVAEARVARLLVAPVRAPTPRRSGCWWTQARTGHDRARPGVQPRIVDWT